MNNIRHSTESPRWGTNPVIVAIGNRVLGALWSSPFAITVDPFSEAEFNELVGAKRILTGERGLDGFKDRWLDDPNCPRADHILAGYPTQKAPVGYPGYHIEVENVGQAPAMIVNHEPVTALVNAPGNDDGSNIKNAWIILDKLHADGWIDSAVWVAFNLNQMQTLQGISPRHPLSPEFTGLRCVPDTRLPFVPHSSRPETRITKAGKEVDNDDAPSHPCFFLVLPSHDPVRAAEQLRLFESMASEIGAVF